MNILNKYLIIMYLISHLRYHPFIPSIVFGFIMFKAVLEVCYINFDTKIYILHS